MKKILLSFLTLGLFFAVHGQQADCDPADALEYPVAFYPDPETNFVSGCVGEEYYEPIFFTVPTDTFVDNPLGGGQLEVDIIYIQFDEAVGLPDGLEITTNPEDGKFYGGSLGCGIISGVPTTPGVYDITIKVTARAGGIPIIGQMDQESEFEGYQIVVAEECDEEPTDPENPDPEDPDPEEPGVGVNENVMDNFAMYPNPSNDVVTIANLVEGNKTVSVYSVDGKIATSFETSAKEATFSVADFQSGVYFVKVQQDGASSVARLIVK